jgi:hypothetical protein
MAKQVTYRDIYSAWQSANRLGFRSSALMLEGLAEQVKELEFASPPQRAGKARTLKVKIEFIRSAVERERTETAKKKEEWFGWQRMNIALGGAIMSILTNGGLAYAAYGACEMFHLENLRPGIAVFAIFAVSGVVKSIGESVRSSREGLVRRIGDTLSGLEEIVGECL